MGIKTFGEVDRRSLEQLERCMQAGDAELGVLCADHHPGYSQPIGGGIAYEGYVSPSGVGYDIGCGNKAVRTDLPAAEVGEAYVAAMELAGEYAYAGRDVVVAKVLEILGAEATHEVHNHHNFAWREEHFGRTYWVIRKGCTPAEPGQEGFVGGSMGDESVILEGIESAEAEESLRSTVHGAGRVMSRSQAAGRYRRTTVRACPVRDCDFYVPAKEYSGQTCPEHGTKLRKARRLQQVKPGVVDWPSMQARLQRQGIVLVGGGADEAPEVYKRLPDVLAAHAGSVRVKHRLRPLGVAMAGRDVYDAYKD